MDACTGRVPAVLLEPCQPWVSGHRARSRQKFHLESPGSEHVSSDHSFHTSQQIRDCKRKLGPKNDHGPIKMSPAAELYVQLSWEASPSSGYLTCTLRARVLTLCWIISSINSF